MKTHRHSNKSATTIIKQHRHRQQQHPATDNKWAQLSAQLAMGRCTWACYWHNEQSREHHWLVRCLRMYIQNKGMRKSQVPDRNSDSVLNECLIRVHWKWYSTIWYDKKITHFPLSDRLTLRWSQQRVKDKVPRKSLPLPALFDNLVVFYFYK